MELFFLSLKVCCLHVKDIQIYCVFCKWKGDENLYLGYVHEVSTGNLPDKSESFILQYKHWKVVCKHNAAYTNVSSGCILNIKST